MYKLVIQLHDLDLSYDRQVIHETTYPEYSSIQECFESIETGEELFNSYLTIDEYVKKEQENILSGIAFMHNLTKQIESS